MRAPVDYSTARFASTGGGRRCRGALDESGRTVLLAEGNRRAFGCASVEMDTFPRSSQTATRLPSSRGKSHPCAGLWRSSRPRCADRGPGPGSASQPDLSSGMTTTFPCALRSVNSRMASTLCSSGKRCVMQGFTLPATYHSTSSSMEHRSLSGAYQRK